MRSSEEALAFAISPRSVLRNRTGLGLEYEKRGGLGSPGGTSSEGGDDDVAILRIGEVNVSRFT